MAINYQRKLDLLSQEFAIEGGIHIDDTDAHTGNFYCIHFLEDSEVTTVGNLELTSVAISANEKIYGLFTSVQLVSGSAICYNKVVL